MRRTPCLDDICCLFILHTFSASAAALYMAVSLNIFWFIHSWKAFVSQRGDGSFSNHRSQFDCGIYLGAPLRLKGFHIKNDTMIYFAFI